MGEIGESYVKLHNQKKGKETEANQNREGTGLKGTEGRKFKPPVPPTEVGDSSCCWQTDC